MKYGSYTDCRRRLFDVRTFRFTQVYCFSNHNLLTLRVYYRICMGFLPRNALRVPYQKRSFQKNRRYYARFALPFDMAEAIKVMGFVQALALYERDFDLICATVGLEY
jgi:hypothetical protein